MKKRWRILAFLLLVLSAGMLIPQKLTMPVEGATSKDYHPESFWYHPWGKSVTHKGVDIFAKEGTPIYASVKGIVVFCGKMDLGGNAVFILGPKWRIHYFAHLKEINTRAFSYVDSNAQIGTVGTSGNAKGKPPHLHYSMMTLIPYLGRMDSDVQGWKKIFYLNPIDFLKDNP